MGLIVRPSCPWLSPDGFILDKNILVEVKTVQNKMNVSVEKAASHFITKRNEEDVKMKVKSKYYGQVQINMMLLHSDSCDLVMFSGSTSEITILYVDYNEKLVRTFLKVDMHHALPYINENCTTDADKKN